MANKVPKILTVEGIIASGKTTLLSKLKNKLPKHHIQIIPEPIAAWENTTKFKPHPTHFVDYNTLFNGSNGIINGDNSKQTQFELLSEMYKDSHRWCLSFQLWALFTRIKSIESAIQNIKEDSIDLILIERSSMANRIFAEIMYDNNYLNECEWLIYNHFFQYFNENSKYLLDAIIYLNCPIDIAMNRINIRNRKGENNITNDYQIGLQKKHNQLLYDTNNNNNNNNIPLFEIGIPYDKNEQYENQIFQNIHDFIANVESKNQVMKPHNFQQIQSQRL